MHWGLVQIQRATIPLIACAILVYFRLHSFDLPLETDEANYAYIGAQILEGGRLYIDVWDHQPPGVFMLFAGAIALFGDSPAVFRVMAIAFSAASLLLIFSILRRISGRPAAILGAILFCIVSSDPGTGGEGVNREIYMNTLILAAWWLALRGWLGSGRVESMDVAIKAQEVTTLPGPHVLRYTLAAGLLLGLASLLKTNVAVYWIVLAFWLAARASQITAARKLPEIAKAVAGFSVGPVVVWAATFAYFTMTQRFQEFTEAVFLVNLDYVDTTNTFLTRFATFFNPPRFAHVFDSALPLWLCAAASLAWLVFSTIVRLPTSRLLIVALVAAAYLAVCLPGRFWPHYYYLLIPPAVIATAMCVASIINSLFANTAQRLHDPLLRVAIPALLVAAVLMTEYRHYLSRVGIEITLPRYNTRDYWGKAQGEHVALVTSPGDTVFVFGNDAAIYYYSGRKCASRFTMITGLHPQMRGADRRRQLLIDDLRKSRPRVIVVLFDQEPFEEWKAFLNEEYGQPVGWDFHDETGKPIMFVMARKDAPIKTIEWNWDRADASRPHLPGSIP